MGLGPPLSHLIQREGRWGGGVERYFVIEPIPDKHLNRNIYSDPLFIVCYHSQLLSMMLGPDTDRNEHSKRGTPE